MVTGVSPGTARPADGRRARWRRLLAPVSVVSVLLLGPSQGAGAAGSPLGDVAQPWPVNWTPYTFSNGDLVRDVLGDQNPAYTDITSGACGSAGCTGSLSSVYYSSDATTAFFRLRVDTDPADTSKGGLFGNAYLVQLAVGGVVKAVIGVDGKSPSEDYVYVTDALGDTVNEIYTYPFDNSDGESSAGMRVVPDGQGQYYLDFQAPFARIAAITDGAVTSTTPVQLFYGSSAAANLAVINKDLMTGSAVSFTGLATISLSPAALSLDRTATWTDGPSPPRANAATGYDAVLSATNDGGVPLTGTAVSGTLPATVAATSYGTSYGSISVTGSAVSWTPGTIGPGVTATATLHLVLTPTTDDVGDSVTLVPALSGSGTDNGSGETRTDTTTAFPVGPVAAGNHTPTAAADADTVAEDGSVDIDVLANDADADSDTLTITALGTPGHGAASVQSGKVHYVPADDYHGSDSVSYRACDPSPACTGDTTVSITVTSVNDPPATSDTALATPEDTELTGQLAATDVDDDELTFSVSTGPGHGTLDLDPDGTFSYPPADDYAGPDSFTYQVCDPAPACTSATVTLTVQSVNDTPVANPATLTVDEDTAGDVTPSTADPDDDELSLTVPAAPGHGTATVAGDTIHYQPDADYHGSDSIDYQVCDPTDACATATVEVTVAPVNDPPAAQDDTVSVAGDSSGTFDPRDNDSDIDGDELTVAVTTAPEHGTATVLPDGTIEYTPTDGYGGADELGYQVCDPDDACAGATVAITVSQPNRPPVLPDLADQTVASEAEVSLDASGATDPDGDPLGVEWAQTGGDSVDLTGADGAIATFTAPVGPAELTFQVTVTDGTDTVAGDLTVTVTAPDTTTPSCVDVQVTAGPDGIDVALTCPGTTLAAATLTVAGQPEHGQVTGLGGGSIRYVPDAGYVGPDSFDIRVCIPAGCTVTAITVVVVSTGSAGTTPSTSLPQTGQPLGPLLGWGLALLAAGLLLAVAARRPRRGAGHPSRAPAPGTW